MKSSKNPNRNSKKKKKPKKKAKKQKSQSNNTDDQHKKHTISQDRLHHHYRVSFNIRERERDESLLMTPMALNLKWESRKPLCRGVILMPVAKLLGFSVAKIYLERDF